MTLVLVVLGGALGAVCRFLISHALSTRGPLPWGTFTVNVAGSLLLGLLAGAMNNLPGWVGPLVGGGFCGALTTYSTFSYETVRLAAREPDGRWWATLNVAAVLAVGLGAAGLGWLLGESR